MAVFSTIIAFATKALIAAAVQIGINLIARSLQKKPKADTTALDFEQTLERRLGNHIPLSVLVGRRIVAGTGYFDDSYGTNREYAVSVSVLSAKPCNEFHTLYLDGEPVTLSGDPTTGERNVTSHFLGKDDAQRAKCRIFLGDDNSGLGAYLAGKFPDRFDSTDNFGDYCVVVCEFRNTNDDFDEDEGENYIPFQGLPEVRVELSGAKICDPRVSGYDYADESTYVYSDNAALIDAQFDYGFYSGTGDGRALIVGNGYPIEIMDIDQIISNADYCAAESYGCSGLLESGQTNDQEEIWKCFNADRVEHAAKIYSVPEGDRVSAGTIDMSDHPAAHVSFVDEHGYSTEVYNEVITTYAEPDEYYAEVELDPYTNTDWIAADNHIPRHMELPLLFVTDKTQAFKLQKEEIYISRTPAKCTISDLPFNYISLKVGNTVTITNSDVSYINDKTWIVTGRSQSVRGDVDLTLRELADSEAFGYDPIAEPVAPPVITPPARDWGTDDWPGARPHVNSDLVIAVRDGTYVFPDIVVQDKGSVRDTFNTQEADIDTLFESAESGGIELSLSSASALGEVESSSTQTVTTNSITVTATGGGSKTYSWTKVSGDTFTLSNASGATTTFSASVGVNSSKSAVYKVTVTDGTNTSSRNVNVYAHNTTGDDFGGGGGGLLP